MAASEKTHAVVIGSGPNGLAAAIELARSGLAVTVYEAEPQIGGGVRSAALTLPGFVHDVCSAVYPMAISSPCFERYPLHRYGLEWIQPPAPLAHALDDGSAVVLERSIAATCTQLGRDAEAWRQVFEPLAGWWWRLRNDFLAPIFHLPRHPFLLARYGWEFLRPARSLADSYFRETRARALFAGLAAHANLPFDVRPSGGIALIMGVTAHAVGWPIVKGGAQRLADALASYLRSEGGEIRAQSPVETLPDSRLVMCDITPRQLLRLAGSRFPKNYRDALESYRYGPAVFKLDWALDAEVPWRAEACRRVATVHLGGTFEEIAEWEANFKGAPFVLLTQPTLFDPSRAPHGKQIAWAYCHVPLGSTDDMTEAVESQIERFAPGFRNRILARHAYPPAALEAHNANLVGGDISGGSMDFSQFLLRPNRWLYRTPLPYVYLCSSSTPPGGAVHGMCGFYAVQSARKLIRQISGASATAG